MSHRIDITCPACNQTLEAQSDTAGQQVDCPACRTTFMMPGAQSGPAANSNMVPAPTAYALSRLSFDLVAIFGLAGVVVTGILVWLGEVDYVWMACSIAGALPMVLLRILASAILDIADTARALRPAAQKTR